MPLTDPVPDRERLHSRRIEMHGFRRPDGLFDIEAHLHDSKSYDFENIDRGTIAAGDALHGMWVRMTVDEAMVIQCCEAVTDFAPYAICPGGATNFASLAGVTIGFGFSRSVKDRVGGVSGCTHLRELLAQMATVAFQTIGPVKWRRAREAAEAAAKAGLPPPPGSERKLPLNSCHAYAPDSPVVLRHQKAAEPS